jgi:hypothetical protein
VASQTSGSSTVPEGLSGPPDGNEGQVETELPTPAERTAFRLLPLVWISVAILAALILYAVFT